MTIRGAPAVDGLFDLREVVTYNKAKAIAELLLKVLSAVDEEVTSGRCGIFQKKRVYHISLGSVVTLGGLIQFIFSILQIQAQDQDENNALSFKEKMQVGLSFVITTLGLGVFFLQNRKDKEEKEAENVLNSVVGPTKARLKECLELFLKDEHSEEDLRRFAELYANAGLDANNLGSLETWVYALSQNVKTPIPAEMTSPEGSSTIRERTVSCPAVLSSLVPPTARVPSSNVVPIEEENVEEESEQGYFFASLPTVRDIWGSFQGFLSRISPAVNRRNTPPDLSAHDFTPVQGERRGYFFRKSSQAQELNLMEEQFEDRNQLYQKIVSLIGRNPSKMYFGNEIIQFENA